MRVVDVNVLLYAHRPEAPRHEDYRSWLSAATAGDEPLGVADIVLAGFVRVATHPRIFKEPTPATRALDFAAAVRSASAAIAITPTARTWPLVDELVRTADLRGNDVHDAYLAALAIEHGATLVSADRGFARFGTLRWRHPLDE